MLRISGLTVDYNGAVALRDLDLEVREGELVVVLGSNGAGKSTLLNTAVGLKRPSAGVIEFEGQQIQGQPAYLAVRHGIALVPEGRRLFSRLSVRRNLLLGAYADPDKSPDKLAEGLAFVHSLFPILLERSTQTAGSLSGGEQQMLAVGRALMSHPRLVLLDEPTQGLAPLLVKVIFDAAKQIRDQGVTVLLVEQRVHQALRIADRAYVLQTGRVVASGTPDELVNSDVLRAAYLGL